MKKALVYPVLILTFFLWATNYVGGKYLSDDLPPAMISTLRCLIAAIVLGVVSYRRYGGEKIRGEDRKYFLLCGLLGYFGTMYLTQVAAALTGASTAALINATTPVIVTVFAALFLHEKITPVKVLCLFLAVGGALVLTLGADNAGNMAGIAAAVGATVCWGFTSVFIRRLTATYPALKITAVCMMTSMLLHIPAGIISWVRSGGVRLETKHWMVIVYLGFMASALAQLTWSTALSYLPASTCSLFYPLQPMFAAVLGFFILGERFRATFAIGLILISADIVLNTWDTHRNNKMRTSV